MKTKQEKEATAAPKATVRDRLIAAAYSCFDRYGLQKTTMDDVAVAAGCSRQTVYNNFATKADIITAICEIEAAKLNETVMRSVRTKRTLEGKITESIMATLRLGITNPYIRRLIEPADIRQRATDPSDPIHAAQRERWAPLLVPAIEDGRIAPDLQLDEIVAWLTMAQMMLVLRFDLEQLDKSEIERLVRRFIIVPLLHRS
ncbi:TetR/AcrR family transcriptional regulator [Pelomonas sp. KK5]|uniref:TetR/AcrR family transcriptional regulator n=1 Tax=Pelomonas sp. KK5 TaxID=1855730 RepID=UPI00097C40AE|nr:TetR/AcrR family transcriptional regulator [Pelomonas sp. KK5]